MTAPKRGRIGRAIRNLMGEKQNRNRYREGTILRGIFMDSQGVDPKSTAWGTLALVTTAQHRVSYRTQWESRGWGGGLLDFWDDFAADGQPEERQQSGDAPMASLAVQIELPPGTTRKITFILSWHFPNRRTWTPSNPPTDGGYHRELLLHAVPGRVGRR
jgi:non-lysosomal glucosylceramidase